MRPSVVALAAAATLLASALPALAAPPSMTDPAAYQQPVPAPAEPTGSHKSESTAQTWSIGGTLAGIALTYAGAKMMSGENDEAGRWVYGVGAFTSFFGPSFGHWYAGKVFTTGLGLRVGALAAETAGILMFVPCIFAEDGEGGSCAVGALLMVGGAGLYLAGTIWDIATADDSVRDWNNKHGWSVMPTAMVGPHGTTPALALTGRF